MLAFIGAVTVSLVLILGAFTAAKHVFKTAKGTTHER